MDKIVNIHTAKTTLSMLVAEVEQGETVFIARAGKTVAKLTASKGPKRAKAPPKIDRKPGFMRGRIKILKGFYDPLPADILRRCSGKTIEAAVGLPRPALVADGVTKVRQPSA